MLKEEGRQFSMFMSENICTMLDLFDKAVAEGASNHCAKGLTHFKFSVTNIVL